MLRETTVQTLQEAMNQTVWEATVQVLRETTNQML